MKKYTAEDIRAHLTDMNVHVEFEEPNRIIYYVHAYANGELAPCVQEADKTFTYSIDFDDYIGEDIKAQYTDDDGEIDAVNAYMAAEENPDSEFGYICETLASEVNDWLEDD